MAGDDATTTTEVATTDVTTVPTTSTGSTTTVKTVEVRRVTDVTRESRGSETDLVEVRGSLNLSGTASGLKSAVARLQQEIQWAGASASETHDSEQEMAELVHLLLNVGTSPGLESIEIVVDDEALTDLDVIDDSSYNFPTSGGRPGSSTTTRTSEVAEHEPSSQEIVDSVIEQLRSVQDPLGRIALGDALSKELMPAVYEQMMADAAEFREGGGTWRQIADELEVSPQAAQQRLDPTARKRAVERTKKWREGQE